MASGSTTFPLAQGGLWTPPPGIINIKWRDVRHIVDTVLDDVTGVCVVYDEGEEEYVSTNDADKVFMQGNDTQEFLGEGAVQNGACANPGLAQAMTYTIAGGLSVQLVQWTLRKAWALQPVGNSAVEEYVPLRPVIQVSANGWATGASGPGMTTRKLTALTLNINGFGTIACKEGGDAPIGTLQQGAALRDGGPIPVAFSAIYSGGVAYTGTNFPWLFPTPDAPVKGTAELTTGETVTNSVLAYDWTFSNPTTKGGSIPVSARFRFDKE